MAPISLDELTSEKRTLLAKAGGGASLPAAGALYWTTLGIAGFFLEPDAWSLVAAFGSGAIFPLGIALQRPLRSNIMGKLSPLVGVAPMAVLGINLLWPLYLALLFAGEYEFVPLALGLGMTMHWPVIGWLYGSRACLGHAITRTLMVSALWFLAPGLRFTVLPLAVAAIYVWTVVWLKTEASAARNLTGAHMQSA